MDYLYEKQLKGLKISTMLKHILIADDDEDDRMLFADALRRVSTEVELSMAADGDELLTLLKNSPRLPDVVFMDLNMPAKNGFESLKEIKKDPVLRELPVIIFTTTRRRETVDQLFTLGARYYLEKPTDFDVLKKLIGAILTASIDGAPQSKKEFTQYMF
jgi:CheY-like chemotaxis protein